MILFLIAMLLAAMNYNNNMAYSTVFFVSSLALVSYLHAIHNLRGLSITRIEPQTAFAGGNIIIKIEINNISRKNKNTIQVVVQTNDPGFPSPPYLLSPLSFHSMETSIPCERRGLNKINRITLFSTYPLGFFKARLHFSPALPFLVYPKPAGLAPFPSVKEVHNNGQEGFHYSGGEDFSGLRPYRQGESQHHVDWKSFARGRPLHIKEFWGGGNTQLWFDWHKLPAMEVEEKISQLTKWVLAADKEGREFGLRLLDKEIRPDSGTRHTLNCLEILALFP